MRWGVGFGEGKLEDSLMVALLDTYCGLYMANTAELYGNQQGVTREMQDEFALRSEKTLMTPTRQDGLGRVDAGRAAQSQRRAFGRDVHRGRPPAAEATMESLRQAEACVRTGGVTAGNASGIVDGGAAVVVMPLAEAEKRNLKRWRAL